MLNGSQGQAAGLPGKERINNLFQFPCHIILPVKLGFIKYGIEYVLSQDMLNDHFPYIIQGNFFINALMTKCQKFPSRFGKFRVCVFLCNDDSPDSVRNFWNILLKQFNSLSELLHFWPLKADKTGNDAMQSPGIFHRNPLHLQAILN